MTTVVPSCIITLKPHHSHRPSHWCVYQHELHDLETGDMRVIYVSWCRLVEVFTFKDAERNTEWMKLVTDAHHVTVRILAMGSQDDCRNYSAQYVRTLPAMPECLVKGIDIGSATHRICCSNGMEYASQQDASAALNIPQGMISQAVNGKIKHAKGLHFWRKPIG